MFFFISCVNDLCLIANWGYRIEMEQAKIKLIEFNRMEWNMKEIKKNVFKMKTEEELVERRWRRRRCRAVRVRETIFFLANMWDIRRCCARNGSKSIIMISRMSCADAKECCERDGERETVSVLFSTRHTFRSRHFIAWLPRRVAFDSCRINECSPNDNETETKKQLWFVFCNDELYAVSLWIWIAQQKKNKK